MRALVFAAGLGTRLRPLTDVLPKPAVPLWNRPLAGFALDHLATHGVTEVVLNTHHLAAKMAEALEADRAPGGPALTFAHEPVLLGTAGGVRHGVDVQSSALGRDLAEDEPLVVFNGDVRFEPDLAAALATHRRLGAYATMVLRAVDDPFRFGAIEIDDEGRVRRLLGQAPTPPGLSAFMFTGVHVLSARAVLDLPTEGCIVRRGYVPWVDRGERIAGHVEAAAWRDLGTPREYLAASLDMFRGGDRMPPRQGVSIDPTARIEGELHETTVGRGATVAPGVRLERCIVWPDTVVRASAADAILGGELVVDAR